MKNTVYCLLFVSIYTLCCSTANAQQSKKEEIASKVTEYFFLERENIHVHFDKDVFLTDEKIWFKGYTYHRKGNIPFFSCVNIFATLMDDTGNVVESQLLYGSLGCFSGSFALSNAMKSGRYYVQFYTNWMNNFTEDESFVSEITVINKHSNPVLHNKPDYSKINIALQPEGGTLVNGIINHVGISLTDCNSRPVAGATAVLTDAGGATVKAISLSKKGFGRFDVIPDTAGNHYVIVTVDGVQQRQALPKVQLKGVSLETNSYAVPDKTIIKTRINKLMQVALQKKPLYLLVHKDEKVVISEINFEGETLEQVTAFDNADLFEGLNTIRIIDSDLNQLAERVIYLYPKKKASIEVAKAKNTGSAIELSGKINQPNMNVSISLLPANTITVNEHDDIYSSLLLKPYLDTHKPIPAREYVTEPSRKNQYELDLFLLSQQSKYKWRNIRYNPPKSNYPFDIGLSLKGTISENSGNLKNYKVKVSSVFGRIDETVDINSKNEFYLENLILADSTQLDFYLVKGDEKKQIKLYPQLFNHNRVYNKQYKPQIPICEVAESSGEVADLPEMPDVISKRNVIMLDEVELNANTSKLKHERAFGNSQLRGYKISEGEAHSFFYVLDLIRYHGFDVENNGVSVGIYGRTINTINGQRTTPMIYIDNMMLMSFDQLLMMQTADIDEFYVNQHAIVATVNNKMGIIKMYMKKNFTSSKKKISPTSFLVEDGFAMITAFKNSAYSSTDTRGFENFGVIDWEPLITTNEKGEFTIEIPRTGQNSAKVLIEGFNADGTLVSEVKTISLN